MRNRDKALICCSIATLSLGTLGCTNQAPAKQSGVIVGNGAGLVEQNIVYAYDALPKAISNCLDTPVLCNLNASDVAVLTQIRAIAQSHPASTTRIQFASEAAAPGFFDTEVGQAYRLAKTGLTPDVATYWNRDQFYNADGTPALSFETITAIWVHELGHQAGQLNHEYLDTLGAAVHNMLNQSYFQDPIGSASTSQNMMLVAYNYSGARPGDMYFQDGNQVADLGAGIGPKAICPGDGSPAIGWSIQQGHWGVPSIDSVTVDANGEVSIPFSAYIELDCLVNRVLQKSLQGLKINVVLKTQINMYFYDHSDVTIAPVLAGGTL